MVLSPVERERLRRLVRTGSHPAQQVRRARILLELDENDPDRAGPVPIQEVVAERVGGGPPGLTTSRGCTGTAT